MKTSILPILVLGLLAICSSCSLINRDGVRIKAGNEIVSRVESFRKDKGRLPVSLSEIGIEEKEEGPIYYEQKSETRYVLWFGKELGESVIYDSEKKKWE